MLNDYFGIADLDGVYWTLQAELKFYFCIFLLITFGMFKRFEFWLTLWIACAATFLLADQPFFMGWLISPEYSSFFIAGVACYLRFTRGPSKYIFAILAGSLILSSTHIYSLTPSFIKGATSADRSVSVALVWCFYLLLYLLAAGKLQIRDRQWYVQLGLLTYPLYLIHNVAGKALTETLSAYFDQSLAILTVVALLLIIAWLSYSIIEKPVSARLKKYLLSMFGKLSVANAKSSESKNTVLDP